jgi:hypothetical protein
VLLRAAHEAQLQVRVRECAPLHCCAVGESSTPTSVGLLNQRGFDAAMRVRHGRRWTLAAPNHVPLFD